MSAPEWKVIDQDWSEFSAYEWSAKNGQRSVNGLCEPGVAIEVRYADGNKEATLLIGDVNVLGGLCDDCSLRHNDRVLRALDLREELKQLGYEQKGAA